MKSISQKKAIEKTAHTKKTYTYPLDEEQKRGMTQNNVKENLHSTTRDRILKEKRNRTYAEEDTTRMKALPSIVRAILLPVKE